MDEEIKITRSVWRGTAVGGPLDGGEMAVETAEMIPVRAVHIVTMIGKDVPSSDWHVYAMTQTMDDDGRLINLFKHQGVFEKGYPPEVS